MMDFIDKIVIAIKEAEREGRVLALDGVTGLSGDKLLGLLQRSAAVVAEMSNSSYLEIGVFQGLTLCSVAAAARSVECYGVDDFSQFDHQGLNRSTIEGLFARNALENATLINADYEDALLGLDAYLNGLKLGVYFIDGPHDYRSQYLCLDFAKPHLASEVVIVVDDSNYEHVRRANGDWLKANPDFALLYEAYTPCHPRNMHEDDLAQARNGWWNGVNVIIHDPRHKLARQYPPVDNSRRRYFNDHALHGQRNIELAPILLRASNESFPKNLLKFRRALLDFEQPRAKFAEMNTYSETLTPGQFTAMAAGYGSGNEL